MEAIQLLSCSMMKLLIFSSFRYIFMHFWIHFHYFRPILSSRCTTVSYRLILYFLGWISGRNSINDFNFCKYQFFEKKIFFLFFLLIFWKSDRYCSTFLVRKFHLFEGAKYCILWISSLPIVDIKHLFLAFQPHCFVDSNENLSHT